MRLFENALLICVRLRMKREWSVHAWSWFSLNKKTNICNFDSKYGEKKYFCSSNSYTHTEKFSTELQIKPVRNLLPALRWHYKGSNKTSERSCSRNNQKNNQNWCNTFKHISKTFNCPTRAYDYFLQVFISFNSLFSFWKKTRWILFSQFCICFYIN